MYILTDGHQQLPLNSRMTSGIQRDQYGNKQAISIHEKKDKIMGYDE